MSAPMRPILTRLMLDDQAQDLIEYALLSAGLGIAGLAAWPALQTALGDAYVRLDNNTQGLWEPPPPGGP